jgi:malonyl CoA-acyl carrier protein transacylase
VYWGEYVASKNLAGASSLRRAYPQGYSDMEKAIADGFDLYTPVDIEVHADRLRLSDRSGDTVAEIAFDIQSITPRGGMFDIVLDHDRESVFLLGGQDTDGLDLLRPYYWLVEGTTERGFNPLSSGLPQIRELLAALRDRPGTTVTHRRIRAETRAISQGRDVGASEVVRTLQRACAELLSSGTDPELQRVLADAARAAAALRRGVRPVLAIRRVSRHAILRSVGAADVESLRRTFLDTEVLSRLSAAHAIDPKRVATMTEDELTALVNELREGEFVLLMSAATASDTLTAPDSLRDIAKLVQSLSSTNAFLFSREQFRRADPAVPDHLPKAGQGRRVVGFFPGLGSRSRYRNLGRSLLDCGVPEVADIYREAARALGFPGRPEKLLLIPENTPTGRMAAQGFIGAAILVHSLAIEAQLRNTAADRRVPVRFVGYTGESFGIITAAVAGGALSIADGVLLAQAFTPLMLVAAEGADPDDPVAGRMAEYLRGTRLVSEPYHVIGLRGEPRDLATILTDIADVCPTTDVEVHKFYSPRQTNIYVRTGAMANFAAFAAQYPAVDVEELKAPTTFLAHAERMIVARRGFEEFMADHGVTFRKPHTPVVSNNDTGLLTTAAEVRNAVLAITNEIMASRSTAETLDYLRPDMILELGLGDRSVHLLADNDIDVPTVSYAGIPSEASPFLSAVRLVDGLLGQLANLHAGDPLTAPHYHTLREISRLSKKDSFYRRYFYRAMGRVVAGEMFHQDRAGSPAFYEFLEIFQHTYNYLNHIDVEVGELVLKARLKKRIAGHADRIGQVYAELTVIDDTGAIVDRRQIHGEHAEVVVFHFDRPPDLGYAELARNTRMLLDTQPLARQVYDQVLDSLGITDDDFLMSEGTTPSAGQLAVGHPVYQYALFQVLHQHRPAMFMHDYYVEGSDPMGWLVALAVAGATTLPDVVLLYEVYLRAAADTESMTAALDRMAASLHRSDIPVISQEGIPLQSKDDLEAATRAVFR